MSSEQLLAPILSFLQCETPETWINEAKKAENLPVILIDHLICELKAGQTAMLLENYSKAEKLFTKIKENYSKSDQGRDVEKFINAAKYAK